MDAHDSFLAQDSASARGDDLANSLLNFTTGPDDLELQGAKRQKSARDPMSHRIIEKRRRDRMNNCLADLSRLIPTSYLKQGQGRIEKTEIIEMAIKHIKTLQAQVESSQNVNFNMASMKRDTGTSIDNGGHLLDFSCCREQFYQGFKECQDEALRYLVEGEAMVASDPFCARVMDHLSSVALRFVYLSSCGSQGAEDKKDALMDVESQPPLSSGPSSFSGSTATTPLPSLDPAMPLLPTATAPPCSSSSSSASPAMMVPASPVRNKQLRNLLSARALQQQLEAEREAVAAVSSTATTDFKSVGGGGDGGGGDPLLSTSSALPPTSTVSAMSTETSAQLGCGVGLGLGVGHCEGSLNGGGGTSSGYVSDTSAMDRFSGVGSTLGGELGTSKDSSSVMNAYKFKHNITKRFSQEGKVVAQQYDGSSSTSSREADDENSHSHHGGSFKHRSLKSKSRYASSTDSGPYPTSDLSRGGTSTSSHESIEGGGGVGRNRSGKAAGGGDGGDRSLGSSPDFADAVECHHPSSRAAMPLPGFVLHPSGTHYMPMSVCYNNNIPDIFDGGGEAGGVGPPVFHPISIPVHLRGPVLSVPSSSLHSQTSITTVKSDDPGAQPRDTKGSKKLQG
ncbi:uncharacterized protein LOC143285102 [Babylonia areolata]|uniref:uncharacterized protein LOC143285102 n=1 Tax=Babylonia areolata TaxID=304850 RepID=UPI003FD005E6